MKVNEKYYHRELKSILTGLRGCQIIGVFGPRGSGKTTLVKGTFPQHAYLSLYDPEIYGQVINNLSELLKRYANNKYGIIIDDCQRIRTLADNIEQLIATESISFKGTIIFVGMYNIFMKNEGNYLNYFVLMSLSLHERLQNGLQQLSCAESILCTHTVHDAEVITHPDVYEQYITSYIEHDLAALGEYVELFSKDIFRKFLQECAAVIGEPIDYAELAQYCGISEALAKRWIEVLEASHLIFFLYPYEDSASKDPGERYKNYSDSLEKYYEDGWKRYPLRDRPKAVIDDIVIHPKLYFYDTGLVAFLLEIDHVESVVKSSFYSRLFENFILADLRKQFYGRGEHPEMEFFSDPFGGGTLTCLIKQRIPICIGIGDDFSMATTAFHMWYKKMKSAGEYAIEALRFAASQRGYIIHDGTFKIEHHQIDMAVRHNESHTIMHFLHDIIPWQLMTSIAMSWPKPVYAYQSVFENDGDYRRSAYRMFAQSKRGSFKCSSDHWTDLYECRCTTWKSVLPDIHVKALEGNYYNPARDIGYFRYYGYNPKKYSNTLIRSILSEQPNNTCLRRRYIENKTSCDGETPIEYAIETSDTALVAWWLQGNAEEWIPDIYGVTPLHRAAYCGYTEMVKLLLSCSIDLHARTVQGNIPLAYAVERSHEAIETLLINKGTDLMLVNYQGCTLLHIAAHYKNLRMVKFLLDQNIIDIDARTITGHTALHYAALHQDAIEIVNCLIEAGARNDIANADGHTACNIVQWNLYGSNVLRNMLRHMRR